MRRFILEPVHLGDVTLPEETIRPTRAILPTWAWVALAIGAAGATAGVAYYASRPRRRR